MGRLAVVVNFAMEADAQYPASAAFLPAPPCSNQRHQGSRTENDADASSEIPGLGCQ